MSNKPIWPLWITADRVLVSAEGEATTPWKAHRMGIDPEIILVRNDGWSIAAEAELKQVAFDLWPNEWLGFIVRPEKIITPIRDWHKRTSLF